MNTQQYDKARRTAQQLEHQIKNMLDDPASDVGRKLLDGARNIEDHFQTKLNPRSIEDRIKNYVSVLDELRRYETSVINAQHARWLHGQYEDLQFSLRQFENY